MDQAADNIDLIVREVMRRLNGSAAQPQSGAARPSSANGHAVTPGNVRPELAAPRGELALAARVISLAQIQDRLDGIGTLRVPAKAVVTPAVRDLLRQRKIGLKTLDATANNASSAGMKLVVALAGAEPQASVVLQALQAAAIVHQQLARTGLTTVVGELCDRIGRGGELGLLATDKPVAALCLANRQRGVRAVTACDPAETAEAIAAVGANLLIVDPRRTGGFQLRRMLESFCDGRSRSCPDWLRGHLD